MNFFRHFSKPTLLSQFLLGMLAILSVAVTNENIEKHTEQTTINQPLELHQLYLESADQQAATFPFVEEINLSQLLQAVAFGDFFAHFSSLEKHSIHPIRAGPFA